MGDIFKEQIVKKQKSVKDKFLFLSFSFIIFTIAILIGGFLTLTGLAGFGLLIILLAFYSIFIIYSYFQVEYEYAVTNDIIDVDIIYNKRKRKNKLSFNIEKIEYLCKTENLKDEKIEVKNFSAESGTHTMCINIGNKKTKILFDPNEEILSAIKRRLPSSKVRGEI